MSEWFRVNSTWIDQVKYTPKLQRLDIRFTDGQATSYHGVNEALWDEFCKAPSPGGFLNRRIRGAYDAHDCDLT